MNELATTSASMSVVETHETPTAPAAGLAARFEVMVNEVMPVAIGAPIAVIVRTFPTVVSQADHAPVNGVA